jgi:hypothetical protein
MLDERDRERAEDLSQESAVVTSIRRACESTNEE